MKQIHVIAVLFFLLWTSCDEGLDCREESAALDIRASINNRVIAKQVFTENDQIGVYLVSYNNGTPGLLGDIYQTTAVNVEYIFDSPGYWHSADGTDLFLSEEPADLYAYHPYDEGLSIEPGKTNLTAYPFAVDTDQQRASGHSDFLWAKVPELSIDNPTAPIVFQHLMCRTEINIRLVEGIDVTGTPELRVYNTRTSCTINLRNGTVSPTGETRIVIPAVNASTTIGFDYTYDAILIPQTLAAGTPFFTITLNDDTYIYELPGTLQLLPQECYLFNLTAGPGTSARGILIQKN